MQSKEKFNKDNIFYRKKATKIIKILKHLVVEIEGVSGINNSSFLILISLAFIY